MLVFQSLPSISLLAQYVRRLLRLTFNGVRRHTVTLAIPVVPYGLKKAKSD